MIKISDRLASFSSLFLFRSSELFIQPILPCMKLPVKRDHNTVSDSSEQVVINFVYLQIILLEYEKQGGETWIMIEVTKQLIHNENVRYFHFSNKTTEN
jgi:hypothetical protein